jgi:hypothetical protein
MAMAKSILERLQAILDADTNTKLKAAVMAHPELLVDDAFAANLIGIYEDGAGSGDGSAATTTADSVAAASTTTTTTATHTAALPSAATTTSTPAATTSTTTSTNDGNAAILAALTALKTTMDTKLANVITKDQLPSLAQEVETRSLRKANELAVIRETHLAEFGKPLDSAAFEKFVLDAQDPDTKRNKYATLTDAFNAMVATDRETTKVNKLVADQVKQKLSGTTVPGQTTSTSLSPAQQVMAKAKKDAAAEGGSRLQNLIARAEAIDKARADSGTVN